jgi:uncharacterized damage-inducible protein DinB
MEALAERLRAVFGGCPWYGLPLSEILRDVDAAAAAAHPWHGVHSVWEVVLHVTVWNQVLLRRMQGEAVELSRQQDWPPVPKFSDSQWQADQQALSASHAALCDAVRRFPDTRRAETVPGQDYDFAFMLQGAVDHVVYHAGQIALLKKQR